MARQAPGKPGGMVRTFIPKSFENDKDPQPVAFDIRYPSQHERRMLVSIDKDEVQISGSIEMMHRCARAHVISVQNYKNAEGVDIANGDDLVKHGETEFLAEVLAEVIGASQVDDSEKKTLSD